MAASTLTTVAYIYKHLYSDGQVGQIAMRDHPLFAMIDKQGGFTGDQFNYPIRYGNPQGISFKFANAQTNAASSKGLQLAAKRVVKYGVITLDGEAMAAAEGNKGAFLDLVTLETESVLEEMGDSLAFDLYRAGTGVRGQRSTAATNIITLSTVDDARNFKVGMTVGASANSDGSTPRNGTTTVTAVDEDAGTITLASAASITSFQDSDYLFRDGDGGSLSAMEGLEALTPLTVPAPSESFRGVDRSVDPRRLAGVRVSDTATTIEENAGLVAVKIAQVGKKADSLFLNPIRFWQVARRLNAKVEYENGGGTADYGFEFIAIHSPAGTLRCYSDPDCPTNRGRVVASSMHYLKHLRDLPHIVSDDGKPSLRSTSADSIEARARCWVNLIQPVPGAHGVFAI